MLVLKKLVSATFIVALVVASIEILGVAVDFAMNGTLFTFAAAAKQRQQAMAVDTQFKAEDVLQGHVKVLHPYLGYVYDASKRDFLHAGIAISEYGFPDNNDLIQTTSDNKVIIGILGGSVAWWFQNLGLKALESELRKLPSLRSKELVIVRMALGGYKQPQQLMAYAYALSLGAAFDVVINLDGYNEVVLYQYGSMVNPFFPHEWELLASSTLTPDSIGKIGLIKVLELQRHQVATVFSNSILVHSVATTVAWQLVDEYFIRHLSEARQDYALSKHSEKGLPFAVAGPRAKYASVKEYYQRVAEVWADSSRAIDALSKARGTMYVHFLQPSQYVPDSKAHLSQAERATAYKPKQAWALAAAAGYPELVEAGIGLREDGVDYHDLTKIFLNHSGTMYADDCCHISEAGNKVMGRVIGSIVAARMAAADESGLPIRSRMYHRE